MVAYRAALYHPQLVTHVFAIGAPYLQPSPTYIPLRTITENRLPSFKYHEQFASGEIEEAVQSKSEIRAFLNTLFGGRSDTGTSAFDSFKGINVGELVDMRQTPWLTEAELDFYVQEFARHGLHGPLNYYRTRELNYLEERLAFFGNGATTEAPSIHQPVLFIAANRDSVLKPEMSATMADKVPCLTKRDVDAGHWLLWEKWREVNEILKEWLESVVLTEEQAHVAAEA